MVAPLWSIGHEGEGLLSQQEGSSVLGKRAEGTCLLAII